MNRSQYYKEYQASLTPEQKAARAARMREARKADPDKLRKQSRDSYHRNKHKYAVSTEMSMLKNSKVRAKQKNVPHSITLEDIVIPEFCPVFPEIKLNKDNCTSQPDSPSLDRVKPELGYVRGNIVVMSHLANTLKSYGTSEQHRQIADWMDTFK